MITQNEVTNVKGIMQKCDVVEENKGYDKTSLQNMKKNTTWVKLERTKLKLQNRERLNNKSGLSINHNVQKNDRLNASENNYESHVCK